jgi:hypothetical protein
MSLLHNKCIERIAAGKASGMHLVQLFETLATDAELHGESVADLAVYYLESDDEFVVGKYVPELHLVVRRIEPDDVEETNG